MTILKYLLRALIIVLGILTVLAVLNSKKQPFDYFYLGIGICLLTMFWQWAGLVGTQESREQIIYRLVSSTSSAILGMGLFIVGYTAFNFDSQLLFKGLGTSLGGAFGIMLASKYREKPA